MTKFRLLFTSIFIFLVFIRLYRIDQLSLFGDELDVGYQAYSLSINGRDYKGNFIPFYIQSLTESRAPLLMYLTIPSVAIFGLTPLGVRLPTIIFSILSLLFFYLLVSKLSKNQKIALMATFLLGLTPWHIHYGRTAFEVSLLLFLILSATFFYYRKNYLLSILLFILTYYTYNVANVFTTFIIFYLFLNSYIQKTLNLNKLLLLFFIFTIGLIPILSAIVFGNASHRFQKLSIFNNPVSVENIITKRTSFSASTKTVEQFFHNKPISWINSFTQNYLNSLSPSFLFIEGDSNPRHSVHGFGLIIFSLFPFFIIGLIKSRQKLFLFWLLAAPVSSSLTIDGSSHATRLFIMLPPLIYFISQGFSIIKSKLIIYLSILIFLIHSILFFHEYFVHYPKEFFLQWNYGYDQLFKPIYPSNRIFISNTDYNTTLPYLFYQKYLPTNLYKYNFSDQNTKNIFQDYDGFKLKDNTYFINNWKSPDTLSTISQTALSGDLFYLFQLKDIPGDWNLTISPLNGFKTLNTILLPNKQIFAQVIQKI